MPLNMILAKYTSVYKKIFIKKYASLPQEEIEDAIQEGIYCYLTTAPPTIEESEPQSFVWLKTVIHRILYKETKARSKLSLDSAINAFYSADSAIDNDLTVEMILSMLSEDEKMLLIYRQEGFSFQEISTLSPHLGSEGTIKTRYFRILKKIKKKMKE